MKAYETSERYAGKVRECCNYATRSAKAFATGDDNKNRQPCGSDEKKLAKVLKADLGKFADKAEESTYTASQTAYILSNLLLFAFMLLSAAAAICSHFFTKVPALFLIIAIIFATLSILAFFGVFGGTSKHVEGVNVFAKLEPSKKAKKRLIIEANLDAPFKRTLSKKASLVLKAITLVSIIIYFIFDIVGILICAGTLNPDFGNAYFAASFPLAIFAFLPLVQSRSVNANASYPGVVDNLLSCYTAAGVLRYMSEMDLRLKHTELCVLLTGSKNADLSGAKAYCKLNAEKDDEKETLVISLDTIYKPETITAISSGKRPSKLLEEAAQNAEVKLLDTAPKQIKKNGSMKAFKKYKYSCATITTLEDAAPKYLGTENDDEDHINVRAVESAMKLCLEAAYAFDED